MTTKQFRWIDRDTAADDMLQLVYHAPRQMAEQALKLLKAFRSPVVISELQASFLDSNYDVRLRREVYDVICATPGNYNFSTFETVIPQVFGADNFYAHALKLLKYHPVNVSWILQDVETKSATTQLYIYTRTLEYLPDIAVEPLLRILSSNADLLDIRTAFRLHACGNELTESWLHSHWDQVMRLWLTDDLSEERAKYWKRLHDLAHLYDRLDKWPELKQSLCDLTSEWVLTHLISESHARRKLIYIRLLPLSPQIVFDLFIKAFEEKQMFLDLEIGGLLHHFGDETVQGWLKAHWDDLIYLCLVDSIGAAHYAEKMRIVLILEEWSELKEALFKNAPSVVEEYDEKKATLNIGWLAHITDDDIQASPTWQALETRRKDYVDGNKRFSKFEQFAAWALPRLQMETSIPKVAAEVYFLGMVKHLDKRAVDSLTQLLETSGEPWCSREFLYIWDEHVTFAYLPIRFEAAYALRNEVSPRLWTSFIQAFFRKPDVFEAITNDYYEDYLVRWISRMTDMLSGVEPELPDEDISLNDRPWFRALVKPFLI